MDWTITRGERRVIRIFLAVVAATATGALIQPDFIPADMRHIIQETAKWVAGVVIIANPFLDMGAGDAKADMPRSDLKNYAATDDGRS